MAVASSAAAIAHTLFLNPISASKSKTPTFIPSSSSSSSSSSLRLPSLRFSRKESRSWPSATATASAAILSMLPTAVPDRAPAHIIVKWSESAIKSFGMGELEARKLKYPSTGTEALLMGILVEGTSEAAKFLRANGITLLKVREETVKLLGKSDMYFFSPEHPPLMESAQRALDYAVEEKIKSGKSEEVTTTHMLLGIWSEEDSSGHKILSSLGFSDENASELAKMANKDAATSYR